MSRLARCRRLLLWISMWVLIAVISSPVMAQGDGTNPSGGTTVHVVQRGENLYRIAMQYGTTIDAIAVANGIADPRYIAVGQRLLIPNAQGIAVGASVSHIIQPGDSLITLAHTYHTTPDQLATLNHITNVRHLYIGQEIAIPQDDNVTPEITSSAQLHYVIPGENLARIALAYHISFNDVIRANDISPTTPLFPGQRLWIPVGDANPPFKDFPPPFTGIALTPVPAIQGQTFGVHITTTGPAALTGTFMGDLLQLVTHDATQHDALIGIHAFTTAGVYPLVITAADKQSTLVLYIPIHEGGYGTETISINTEKQDLLTADVTEPEWQKVATIMSGFTAQKYFDGLMGLPSTGAITSQFGTRRSYNGGELNSFHSGTDFGGGPGSPILAPAAGVVVLAEALPVRGNATIIDHGWGVTTGYWHQTEILVNVGDIVMPGQTIGTIGSTGRSTGPHLHWEMWVSGTQVDPMQWVQQKFP